MASSLFNTAHSPIGLWNFQEVFTDSSGNGNDLTADTTPNYAQGHAGGFVSWSNQTNWGEILNASASDFQILGAITVQALLHPRALAGFQTIAICQESAAADADNICWGLQFNGTQLRYIHEGPQATFRFFDAGHFEDQAWLHVAITRDSAGTGVKLYTNGIEIHSETMASAPTGGTNSSLFVGADSQSGGNPYKGLVAGVKIVAGELTAGQILAEAKLVMP